MVPLPDGHPGPWAHRGHLKVLAGGAKAPSVIAACLTLDASFKQPDDAAAFAVALLQSAREQVAAMRSHPAVAQPGAAAAGGQQAGAVAVPAAPGAWMAVFMHGPAAAFVQPAAAAQLQEDSDNAVLRVLDTPSWRACGFWGRMALLLLTQQQSHTARALVRQLWETSDAMSARAPLQRELVREFISALVLLLRHRSWRAIQDEPHGISRSIPAAQMLHDALLLELQMLEARDVHDAAQWVSRASLDMTRRRREPPYYTPWPVIPLRCLSVRSVPAEQLTSEQMNIVSLDLPLDRLDAQGVRTRDVSITMRAFAGTGKTATARLLVEAHPGVRFLYTCFNRAPVDEASQLMHALNNFVCKTTHSLTHCEYREHHQPFGKELVSNLQLGKVRDVLWGFLPANGYGGMNPFSSWTIARIVCATVENFCRSAAPEITETHVPPEVERPPLRVDPPDWVQAAREVWRRVADPQEEELAVWHNGYLKLFALNNRRLEGRFDVIIIDEAQDINEVTLQILLREPCNKVIIGDLHQHVYSFNGCINVLDGTRVTATKRCSLSASFRVGPEVAEVANQILRVSKKEQKVLLGLGYKHAAVFTPAGRLGFQRLKLFMAGPAPASEAPLPEHLATIPGTSGLVDLPVDPTSVRRAQVAYISRTNMGWLMAAAEAAAAGRSLYILARGGNRRATGGAGDLSEAAHTFSELKDVYLLSICTNGSRPQYQVLKELNAYDSYFQFKERAKHIGNQEWLGYCKVVDFYKQRLPSVLESIQRKQVLRQDEADYLLMTCHRSKGLEFDHVQVADDYWELMCRPPHSMMFTADRSLLPVLSDLAFPPEDEFNLLYVAVTRAKRTLLINKDLAAFLARHDCATRATLAIAAPAQAAPGVPPAPEQEDDDDDEFNNDNDDGEDDGDGDNFNGDAPAPVCGWCRRHGAAVRTEGALVEVRMAWPGKPAGPVCEQCAQRTLLGDLWSITANC